MKCQEINKAIHRIIRTQSYPLGIKLFESPASIPVHATRPSKFSIKISLCQWITMARRWGRTLGAIAEDINCTPCLAALGLCRLKNETHLSQYFIDMGYFDNLALAERATRILEPIKSGDIGAIGISPLHLIDFDPDIVVVYGTPDQMARLAAGYVYNTGILVPSLTSGFGISCLSTVKPFFNGQAAIVNPGRGERMLAGTDNSEMLFSFPFTQSELILDGLEKTQEKGTRYPVQSYMIYEPRITAPMRALGYRLS